MFGLVKFTDACNMACRYCCMGDMVHSTTMSLTSAHRVVETILAYYSTLSCSEKDICFHGGEPSILGADYLNSLWRQIRQNDPTITISMQSNMYSISEDLINVAKENKVKISTSLDGPKGIHNISRIDHAGNGTFDRILANLQRCKDAGISLGVICTLNSYNWDKSKELYSFD